MKADIINSILGWKELDIAYVNSLIDSSKVDIDVVIDMFEKEDDITDINIVIYYILKQAYHTFEEKVLDYTQNEEDRKLVYHFDPNIYTNYMDSDYDSILTDYDLTDFSGESIERFIKELREIKE